MGDTQQSNCATAQGLYTCADNNSLLAGRQPHTKEIEFTDDGMGLTAISGIL